MDEGSAHPRLILQDSKQENIVGPKMEQEPLVGHEFARVVDSNYQDRAKGSFGGAKSRKDKLVDRKSSKISLNITMKQ